MFPLLAHGVGGGEALGGHTVKGRLDEVCGRVWVGTI